MGAFQSRDGHDCWGFVREDEALRRERDSLVQELETERQRAELHRDMENLALAHQEELNHANQRAFDAAQELARAQAAIVHFSSSPKRRSGALASAGGEEAKAAFRVVGGGGFRSNSYIMPTSSPVIPRYDISPGYGGEGDKARTRRLRAELNSHRRNDYAPAKRDAVPWVVCAW